MVPSPPSSAANTSAPTHPHVTPLARGRIQAEGLLAKHLHLESLASMSWHDRPSLVVDEANQHPTETWDKILQSFRTSSLITKLKTGSEKGGYQLIIKLLNTYSRALFDASGLDESKDFAIVFRTYPDQVLPGFYLGEELKPDIIAERTTYKELMAALEGKPVKLDPVPWSLVVSVAEHKKQGTQQGLAQLASYMSSLRRYRPDLPTVYGYTIAKGKIQIAGLNACEMFVSAPEPWSTSSPWVAYVSLVYRSVNDRDNRFNYATSQTLFYRWDVRHGSDHFAVAPFHISRPPGRITFASFQLLPVHQDHDDGQMQDFFLNREAQGFWKLSSQDAKSRWHEGDLLDYVHRKGWVPGVARHESVIRDPQDRAISGGGMERVKESILLRSIGEPLSRCATPRELLYVLYDALEAHAHMCDLGVLHRDISWNNVLCHPKHFSTQRDNDSREKARPCIKSIMGSTGFQRQESYESCALLIDLDHGAKISELRESISQGRKERTGTPMFVAVEIATPRDLEALFPYVRLTKLASSLNLSTLSDDLIRTAFPGGHHDFEEKFKKVVAQEEARDASGKGLRGFDGKAPLHSWRHDAESLYWVLLWAFARARPLDASDEIDGNLDRFCGDMLEHRIDQSQTGDSRRHWRYRNELVNLFHPSLKPLGTLFGDFAEYLCIPWHLYESVPPDDESAPPDEGSVPQRVTVHDSHMHFAFRILLLRFLLDPEHQQVLDTPLDVTKPRYTSALQAKSRHSSVSLRHRASTGNPTNNEPQSGQQKRGANETAGGAPPAKRIKSSVRAMDPGDDPADELSADELENDLSYQLNDDPASLLAEIVMDEPANEDTAQPGPTTSAPEYPPWYSREPSGKLLSASDLIRMTWNDRRLWFGSGR